MANSITASTVSPFSGLLLSDANYVTSASLGVATNNTPSLFFPNIDYPTVGKFVVQVALTAATNTTGSINVVLQESVDNANWTTIAIFANPLVTAATTSQSSSAASAQVLLSPNTAKPYLRAQAVALTTGATGSVVLSALF